MAGARMLSRLPVFLRNPIGTEHARNALAHRNEQRVDDFLGLVDQAVFRNATSPYHWLLGLAGCERGDFERLVRQEGVEGGLKSLYRHGVYLTTNELKGRRPTVRGSASLTVTPDTLRNPKASVHTHVQSGGSRGPRTAVGLDLDCLREEAVNLRLWFDARRANRWTHALWGVPGSAAIRILLRMCAADARPTHWFSQIDPEASDLHPRYRWSARIIRWGARAAGFQFPAYTHVPLEDPLPIARWMADVLRSGGVAHLQTYSSAAARLCQRAMEAGVDLRGAQFILAGEAVTPARLAMIRDAGGVGVPSYSAIEVGNIGYGCLAPEAADDLHLLHDLHAVIQPGTDARDDAVTASALLVTSLRPTAPLFLMNAVLGDQAVITNRACGCPMAQHGWTVHLHTVRSYEKITAGGMTFFDIDVIRVLEEVLPARFGGAPTDYQLVEEESEGGRPRLRLVVDPSVGPLDTDAMVGVFLAALGGGSGVEEVMRRLWQEGRFLGVERAAPRTTAGGKIQHLHQMPGSADRW
jgi:hypothetical protein